MRFVNVFAALTAIASISSALNIPSTDTRSLERRVDPVKKPVTPAKKPLASWKPIVDRCGLKMPAHKMMMARGDETLVEYDETTNTYVILGGGFLSREYVAAGSILRVENLSGCSGVYFFDGAGRASVTHITAGSEKAQAKEAAQQAKAAGGNTAVKVFAHDRFNFADIKKEINAVLPGVPVTQEPYTLNLLDSKERHAVTYTAGDTSNHLTASSYKC